MKSMVKWSLLPGSLRTVAEKFLAGEGGPQEGVKMLGRWHQVDLKSGYTLYETDRPEQLFRGALKWGDLLHVETHPVLEDGEIAPLLMEQFKK